jgi:hypothetical protein
MQTEGLRKGQLPMTMSFFAAMVINTSQRFYFNQVHLDGYYLFCAGTVFYKFLTWKYGNMTFEGIDTTGPYQVGYTEKFKMKKGNFCVVYYPIDEGVKGIREKCSQGYVKDKDLF